MNELRYKRLDDVLKAGTIIVAVLIGFFLGRTTIGDRFVGANNISTAATTAPQSDIVGQHISLPGVDWAQNQRTLVLALQTTCHFCSESGPFYQKMVRERGQFKNTRLVAVLPQAVEDSKAYLDALGVPVDDIRQGSLSEIGVGGTPTLLLVDSAGVIVNEWSGKLQPSAQNDVLARLEAR